MKQHFIPLKKIVIFILLILFSSPVFSQVIFQPGYIINNSNEKKDVFIRNDERNSEIKEIKYKAGPDAEVQTAQIKDVKEFGIGDLEKYVRVTVDLDRSSDEIKSLSTSRNPVFNEETVFLRVLITGQASLYRYQDGFLERFFYQIDEKDLEQLIYKRFVSSDSKIRENNRYKQQILNDLPCEDYDLSRIQRVKYRSFHLIDIFKEFNECSGAEYDVLLEKNKGTWNFRSKAGINITNFGTTQEHYQTVTGNQYKVDPRIGLELEYIFPLNKKKWALFLEPSFTMHKNQQEIIVPIAGSGPSNPGGVGGYPALLELDYTAFELPVGLRYYFFLNKAFTSKLFVNGGISVNWLLNSSTITNTNTTTTQDIDLNTFEAPTGFAGFGYDYTNKLRIEARYYPVKPVHDETTYKIHQDHSFAVLLGYKLF